MKTFFQIFSTTVILWILITAGLFDPDHAAPGLHWFGYSEQLETLGRVSAMAVPIVATVYTVLLLVIIVAIGIIIVNPKASGEMTSPITNKASTTFSIILFAFLFATGFWYAGIVGLLMNLSGIFLVHANMRAQEMIKNQSSE